MRSVREFTGRCFVGPVGACSLCGRHARKRALMRTHLEIAGVLVAPARTRVYGRPAQSNEAERMGAAIGAVARTTGAVAQRGEKVRIPSETLLEFRLQQPASLPARK